MAVSRPLLLVLIAALAVLAVVTGARVLGGGAEETSSPAPTAAQTSASAGPTAGASSSPRAQTSTPARPPPERAAVKREPRQTKDASPQARVLRALAKRRVIVLFFGQYHSADDRATRNAVRAVGREADVVVTVDLIKNVAKYPRVVSGLGLAQNPSTAIIDRRGQAQVVEGFLDKGSLRQLVADARS